MTLFGPQSFVIAKLNHPSRSNEPLKQFGINFIQVLNYKISNSTTKSMYISNLSCTKSDNIRNTGIVTPAKKGDNDDGNGNMPPPDNGNSGGGDGGGDEDDHQENEFGPLMKFDEVMEMAKSHGVNLPKDMSEAAKATGLRKLILTRYLDLQTSGRILGFLARNFVMFRNRMLADPSFLFKVGTEMVIDSCSATVAEVQKRGKDFWDEFELYAADFLVGIVVDIALVGLLAPYARFGKQSVAGGGLFSNLRNSLAALPSSVFEFERPGSRFSAQQRIATFFYKGLLYGSVGFGCGLVCQGFANMIMNAKRRIYASERDVRVPPLIQSALLWGVFLGVSANTRYQIINGLESVVEASSLAKQVPLVARTFTVGVRLSNNIYGWMQFVDWAKWSGVQ